MDEKISEGIILKIENEDKLNGLFKDAYKNTTQLLEHEFERFLS